MLDQRPKWLIAVSVYPLAGKNLSAPRWRVPVPLVFVHGVSVREGKAYAENLKRRDGLFRKYALKKFVRDSGKVLEPISKLGTTD
jgi:hypothetical protein